MSFSKRPLVFFAIPFLLSTAVGAAVFTKSFSLTALFVSLLIAAVVFLVFFIFKLTKKIAYKYLLIASVIFLSVALGFLGLVLFYEKSDVDFSYLNKQSVSLNGVIKEVKSGDDNNVRYTVEITEVAPSDNLLVGKKVYLYSKADTLFEYGQEISSEASLNTPTAEAMRYMKEQGVFLNCFSRGLPSLAAQAKPSLFSVFKSFNKYLCERVDLLLPKPYSPLVKAMLLGDTTELDTSISTVFMKGGLSHVFSVSGLHIAIMSSLVTMIISAFRMPMLFKNGLSILAVWSLVLITGFEIPACRSGVMMTLFLIAPLFKRESDPITALTVASILVALQNPLSIISLSFLLTVFSTGGILIFAKRINFGIKLIFKKIPNFISNSLSVTLASNLAILPISILFFKGISVVSPLTNLLLLPILPLLMALCILMLILGSIPILSVLLCEAVKALISMLLFSSRILSSAPFSYVGLDYPFVPIWLFVCAISAVLCYFLFYEKKGSHLKRKYYKQKTPTFFKTASLLACALIICGGVYSFANRNVTEIIPVATTDGMATVIKQNNSAIVVSLLNSPSNDKKLINLFLSKNITELNSYLSLDNKNKSSEEKELLFSYYNQKNPVVFQNEIQTEAASVLSSADTVICPDGYGYSPGLNTTAFSLYGESGVVTRCGNQKVLYTNSVNIAKKYECDVLFFGGDYEKIIEQNGAKCVILLEDVLREQKPVYLFEK